MNKIKAHYYYLRSEVGFAIETLRRILTIAKIVRQNYPSREIVQIAELYKAMGFHSADNMLMFHHWNIQATKTTIKSSHNVITVEFDMRSWKEIGE